MRTPFIFSNIIIVDLCTLVRLYNNNIKFKDFFKMEVRIL